MLVFVIGSMDKGRMFNTYNMKWIKGKRIRYDLTSIIPNKIIFENDANCFALSEAIDGVAKDYSSVFELYLDQELEVDL